MHGTQKRLTHGAKQVYESKRRFEREERGRTRKQNDHPPLLFILSDNGDRPGRGPIVRVSRDQIFVQKRKLPIVHHFVGQWPLHRMGTDCMEFEQNFEC